MKNDTTKQALANALKQLLQKKQVTKITINDIAEACGVSRMTFYYHFKDIYDLADWTLQEELHTAIADNRTHDNWQQGSCIIPAVTMKPLPVLKSRRAWNTRALTSSAPVWRP